MTTFARLAKVIKGYTPPIGWIERAFAGLATAVHNILPSYSSEDNGKKLSVEVENGEAKLEWVDILQVSPVSNLSRGQFLGSNENDNGYGWKPVRQTPVVGENDKDKYLHTNASTGDLEWGSVASDNLIVTIQTTGSGQNTEYSFVPSAADIISAYNNGKHIELHFEGRIYQLTQMDTELSTFVFSIVNVSEQYITMETWLYGKEAISHSTTQYPSTP